MKKIKPYKNFYLDVANLYGNHFRVYGPFIRKQDGRKIVSLYDGKHTITKLYAKVKLEIKLKRMLSKDETVDHIDEDNTNDKFNNLQLLTRLSNKQKNEQGRFGDYIDSECPWCHTKMRYRLRKHWKKRGHKLKFCSNSCRSKHYGKQRSMKRASSPTGRRQRP